MTKRIIALFMLLVLLVGALPMTAMAQTTRYVYTSNGKTLNMRREPVSPANNVIAQIPYGAAVVVHSHNGVPTGWSRVTYNDLTGYVMDRYLVDKMPVTPDPGQASGELFSGMKAADYDVIVHASTPGGHVNLRWAPTKQANVHKKVADGTYLHVIAQNGTWAQVINPNTYEIGFMMRSFLRTW